MYSAQSHLVLGSSSPRRKELLTQLGLEFEIDPSGFDEDSVSADRPEELVQMLAECKADELAERRNGDEHEWILTADTVVALDRTVFGKPENDEHAVRMLKELSDKSHSVWGGICLFNKAAGVKRVHVSRTEVVFGPMSERAIRAYVATGCPHDKAGSYAIQGVSSVFVKRINGSYTNVVGLDCRMAVSLLCEHGVIAER